MQEIIKEEDKLQIAKILDKIKFCQTRNKIENTDFLDEMQQKKAIEALNKNFFKNYIFFGGGQDSSRKILILYPEKLEKEIVLKNLNSIIDVIRITLPNNLNNKYEHRDYLSGIMKLGIKREKFGDIIVSENGADILVLKEISEYLKNSLKELIRFQKSQIEIIPLEQLKEPKLEFNEFKIIVNSLRLDNFVSELSRISRTKAVEKIEQGMVLVNYEIILKIDKKVKEKDIITIRGSGKFIFDSIEKISKKDKFIINIKRYV